ncbi:MAG: hypothetical protein ACP5KW_09205 [Thermoproteota archaeon]|jgi:hypothetical protein
MKWYTHIFASTVLFVLLVKIFNLSPYYYFLAILASVFPDLIESLSGIKHRSWLFHEYALYLIPFTLGLLYPPYFSLTVFGAFALYHLALDSLTKSGVFFFGKRIKGSLKTESVLDNATVMFIHLIVGIFAVVI